MLNRTKKLAKNINLFPIEESPLLGETEDSYQYCQRFLQRVEKHDVEKLKPSQLFKMALQSFPRDCASILISMSFYALIKLSSSILIDTLLQSVQDYSKDELSTSTEKTEESKQYTIF